jgi:CubicO group peptidase (beta-lactamase class C family)
LIENLKKYFVEKFQAGLPVFDEELTLEDAKNPDRMVEIIEKSTPLWKPGTKSGYHALTYGWLVDQIVRKVDPKKRTIGQFFREEIAQKHSKYEKNHESAQTSCYGGFL